MKRIVVLLVMSLLTVSLVACDCCPDKKTDKVCSSEQCDVVCSESASDNVDCIDENSHADD